jgi:hypothetical protein
MKSLLVSFWLGLFVFYPIFILQTVKSNFIHSNDNDKFNNSSTQSSHKICDRITIWSWNQFEYLLRGCTGTNFKQKLSHFLYNSIFFPVIEGSLQINILVDSVDELMDVSSLSFPELREITGFLMFFCTEGIISLKNLFPSLEVIRGQELVENYALVVSKMPGR